MLAVSAILAGVLGLGAGWPAAAVADNPFGDASIAAPLSLREHFDANARARGEYQILLGELALTAGDTQRAAQAYVAALSSSEDPALAKRATQIALAANRHDLAYRAAQVWAQARPDDEQAQRAAVRLAFVNDDAKGLARAASALVASAESSRAGYEVLAQILSDKPAKADLAVSVLQKLASAHAGDAAAQYALGRLALNYNRLDVAAQAAAQAVDTDPGWAEAALLRTAIDVRQGHFERARQRVDGLSGSKNDRAQYHVALARMLLQAGKNQAGLDEFKQAVSIDPDFHDARYGLGLVALSHNALDTAATQFQQLYEADSHRDDAAFYLGVIAERREQPAKARDWYERVTEGDHAFQAEVRTAQIRYRQGDLAGARKQLHELAEQYPDQSARLHAVEGGLLVEAGQPKKALAVYNQALADQPEDGDLLYSRSLVYERLGRIEQAKADLKKILSKDDDNPAALNALGYLLTNHGHDYAVAERYIRKSLAQDPDNPAVLDSLGWVEYKQGKLTSARKHLERAYQGSSDPEIAAHLGEVRWQQGDHEAARQIWDKAMAKYPGNTTLKQTIKRLSS
ncbi:tetratricopeptide repeat protein [Salinisphaera sp. SPP-AMP-43]|uniref:tetratricopeptide repeat protein n=1 Tax=Salinisphaera sp. SPP-AMP-43 TaxID=3121288 RepID=UPI003C6E59D8